jgi:hypothetical protein
MAKLTAASLRYETNSKDYRDILHDFLAKELEKSERLTREDIIQLQTTNKFAYLRTALRRDFIDDLRGTARKTRLHAQYVELKERVCNSVSESEELATSGATRTQPAPSTDGLIANNLSKGEAAIWETLLSLLWNSQQCNEFVNPECSDTKCKSQFVKYVAAERGVGEQVVRRDIARLKGKFSRSNHSPIRGMLQG